MLVGLAYAFAVAAVFSAGDGGGLVIDTLVGFSFGSLIDPLTGNQSMVIYAGLLDGRPDGLPSRSAATAS